MLDGNWPFLPSSLDGSSPSESCPAPFSLPTEARLDPEFRRWADTFRSSVAIDDPLAAAVLSALLTTAWRLRGVQRREPLDPTADKPWGRVSPRPSGAGPAPSPTG